MSNLNNVRNDVKQVAQVIEQLAHQVQLDLEQGKDIVGIANELARNSSTFVFTMGALYTLGQTKATVVGSPNQTVSSNKNFYNVRDSFGRFVRV